MNHLEQLVAEWYEYCGYFVRRNVMVGRRPNGGYECELDVVAFSPETKHLIHVEPSMDAHTWERRRTRFTKKFEHGRRHIPPLFSGLDVPDQIDQVALLGFGSNSNVKEIGGGRVATVRELLLEVTSDLKDKRISRAAVPEQFPLLRTVQYCCENVKFLFGDGNPDEGLQLATRFARRNLT